MAADYRTRIMGKVVNLRQARKAKARERTAAEADANRALHGRTRAQKLADKAERDRLAKTVDGARLEDDGDAV